MQGRSKLLITLDRLTGSLRRCTRSQRDSSGTGGEQLQRWVDLPVKVPSGNSIVTEA
jgi:hypothetical protein